MQSGPQVAALIVLWYLTVVLTYRFMIVPVWSYLGFTYAAIPVEGWLLGGLLAFVPGMLLPTKLDRPSRWLAWSLYLIVYVPACFVPVVQRASDQRSIWPHFAIVVVMAIILIAARPVTSAPAFSLRRPQISEHGYIFVVWILFIACLIFVVATFGPDLFRGDLFAIRARRLASRDVLAEAGLTGYALNWLTYAILPLMFGLGMTARRRSLLVGACLGAAVVFGATAARAAGAALVIVGLTAVLTVTRRARATTLLATMTLGVAVIAVVYPLAAEGHQRALEWLVYRNIFTASSSIDNYVEFFQTAPSTNFSNLPLVDVLGPGQEQQQSIARAIGYARTGDAAVNENANFIAYGYAAAGLAGVAIMGGMFLFTLFLLDIMSTGRWPFATVVLSAQAINLINIPLPTMALSGGLGVAAMLVFVAPVSLTGTPSSPFRGKRVYVRPAT